MTETYTEDYLLNKKVKVFQPLDGYRTSSDAVLLSSLLVLKKAGETILDVGAGNGGVSLCLAYSLQNMDPKIVGLELQTKLTELAQMSAKANGFDNFLQYINADIRGKIPLQNCSFHHVITNPPYTQKDMPSPNTSKAFAHNHQDFSLEKWLNFCLKMLRPRGFLYLINRAEALAEILPILHHKAGNISVFPIYSKTGQMAKRVMLIAQKDAKSPLKMYHPLIVHKNNTYSPEAEKILREGKDFFTATQQPLS